MSRFYGVMRGSAKSAATRRGTAITGLTATAAGWAGSVVVELANEQGRDRYTVTLKQWDGVKEAKRVLAEGLLDELVKKEATP